MFQWNRSTFTSPNIYLPIFVYAAEETEEPEVRLVIVKEERWQVLKEATSQFPYKHV